MATDICLPFLKFSHATGVRNDNSIPWIHLSASDIFVVVKGVNTHIRDGQLMIRIIQGNTVLESLDVGRYVDAAIETRRRAEQAGVAPQVSELPVFGITQENLAAIRYRQEDGQARRIQLRMRTSPECRQLVDVLERRGMEFQEQRPRTARPGTGRPSTNASISRPLTLQSNSPYFQYAAPAAGSRPSPFTLHSVEAGSLSQNRSPSSEQPPSRGREPLKRPEPASQEMPPPPLFRRDEASGDAVPTRPTTAQIYRSYTTLSQPSSYNESEATAQQPNTAEDRPSSASQVATLKAVRQAMEEYDMTNQSTVDSGLPTMVGQSHSTEDWSSGTINPVNPALLSSEPSESRPASARLSTPATMVFPETLEYDIPPRRELPFPRPESRQSTSEKSGSRPATARPASKSPTKSNSASPSKHVSPPKKASPSRPTTASPLKRSFGAFQEEADTAQQAANATGQSRAEDTSPTKTSSPALSGYPTDSARKSSRMDELLARKKPLAERSTNSGVPRLSSLVDAPHEIVSPSGTAMAPEKSAADHLSASPRKRAAHENDFTVGAYAAIRSPTRHPEEVSLEEYAAQSQEDRVAAINEFFVSNLENPSFVKLCEDVGNCWRRVGLGQ